ncbi:MAG: efflux RND transporter periplasmic adaptor subunit [Bacteroidetes bacterium]|nr:efflux RND transporter periplasmic adaptor subunit [Bacteroidota bacterium]
MVAMIAVIASCAPADDKMRIKLDRQIAKANEKIERFENKIAGYEQRMKMLEDAENGVEVDANRVVTTVKPEIKNFKKFIEIQGGVSSKKNVMISSNTGGVLMSVLITEGQYVARGQAIAVVNSDILQSNIREVEGALELANSVFERQQRLWLEQQIGTELQYLQAKNNKESLEKKLETLQVQLDDATVRSSISGLVDEVWAKQGEMIGPGNPIARIVNLDRVQVEAEIPEKFIVNFNKGDKVEVYFPSLKLSRTANIKAVGQVINPGNRTFKVEVDMTNSDGMLKPYMLATLKLMEYESSDKVIIPTKLIQDGSKGNFIFAVTQEYTVEKKWIVTGESYDGESEVLEGLEGSEDLIDLGFRDVLEGTTVDVKAIL